MFIFDIIEKKKNKKKLTREEIDWLIKNYVNNVITDCQMSGLLMAICLNGMSENETYYLTKAMQNSGKSIVFDFPVVDKHSTGGVSDTTTLVLTPTLALMGVFVAKMSGKSLGFSGGTLDKLEVFEGYNYDLSEAQFKKIIKKTGASIIGQTNDLVIADKKIYALRDRTGTVSSIPLIASSIMSKKLASGSNIILLDVKYGEGAFMKTKQQATKLAKLMVKIGKLDGKIVRAVITNMNVPLSNGVGSAMEVYTTIEAINGKNSPLLTVSKALVEQLFLMAKNVSIAEARIATKTAFDNPSVILEKLKEIIVAHGGNATFVDNKEGLLNTKNVYEITCSEEGFIANINAFLVANFVFKLKEKVSLERRNFQGVMFEKSVGDCISKGNVLVKIYSDTALSKDEREEILASVSISNKKPKKIKLIEKVVS